MEDKHITLRQKFDDRIYWFKEFCNALEVKWDEVPQSDKLSLLGVVYGGFCNSHLTSKDYYFMSEKKFENFPKLRPKEE